MQKILVIRLQQITNFSVKVVNLETIIDMQSWCRTWPPNGSSRIRAKQKLLRKHKGACQSSWSQMGSLKSFTLTIPWNLANPVKISPGIIARLHHIDQKHMGLLKEQCAELKKAPLPYCCNQVWMKIGGQIPWNATPICETFKISCLMGKLLTRDVLGNHLQDPQFRLVHWLSITLFLRKTSQESINLERKSCLDCSLDTHCTPGGIWKGDVLVADLEELETMDASEIYSKKTQCERGDLSQRKRRIYFSNRRWTNQTPWRRSGPENIHLDTAATNSRRKSHRFSWRIRRVFSTTS